MPEKSGATTLTMEVSNISYTLNVPANCTSPLTAEGVRDGAPTGTEIENGGSFTISLYAKLIIYVRTSDKKGNVGYYCSDGFVEQRCYADGDDIIVAMDNSQLPAGTTAHIATYDSRGKFLSGEFTENGWKFGHRIAE